MRTPEEVALDRADLLRELELAAPSQRVSTAHLVCRMYGLQEHGEEWQRYFPSVLVDLTALAREGRVVAVGRYAASPTTETSWSLRSRTPALTPALTRLPRARQESSLASSAPMAVDRAS